MILFSTLLTAFFVRRIRSQSLHVNTLEEALLYGTKSIVRPVLDTTTQVNVTFDITLHQVVEVQETENLITCQYWVRQSWTNQLLTWNPNHWNGAQYVNIHAQRVWTPDIVLYNDADEELSGGGMKESSYIIVHHNGTNEWKYSVTYKSTCQMDVRFYPFDYQTCELKFGSWVYDNSLIRMKRGTRPLINTEYVNSTEWEIEKITSVQNSVTYSNYGGKTYDDVTITFVIKRNWESQIFLLLGPCLLMLLTTMFSFSIPPDCSERITVIVTNLVAFAISFDMTSTHLPRSSDAVSAVSLAYNVLFVESCVSLFVACCILKVYHKGSGPNPPAVPSIIRKLLLNIYVGKYESNLSGMAALPFVNEIITSKYVSESSVAPLLPTLFQKRGEDIVNTFSKLERVASKEAIDERTLKRIKDEVQLIASFMTNSVRKTKVQNEWRLLGNTLDWIYFTVFFLVVVFSTSYIVLSTMARSRLENEHHF